MKICTKCNHKKTFDDFHVRKESRDGYQAICKKCTKEANALWYKNNKNQKLSSSKSWYSKNKERKIYTQQKWVEQNKQKYLDGCSARRHRRRARELNADGYFSKEDVRRLYNLQKGFCAGCGIKLQKYHVDHIMPLALNGTNWFENLQILCAPCNLSKHAKHPVDWANENGKLL